MPYDIFISYSRKDSEQALALAEQLRASGTTVWIDQQGIVGAEQWATEIVEGIRACSTFIVLLSPESVASENVLKELSLASEKRKRILPVDLREIELPSTFEYPLAGLQRVAISNFDAILRAHKHGVERIAVTDTRKSLMILPFEDLSPSADNAWFADGLASELISSLSAIKSLRVTDNQTTKEYKKFNGRLVDYAREMHIRYFLEGQVRKFGEQIKISISLLDIEEGEHLWTDVHKGEFKDIFDIQEEVAKKVVAGLKLTLTKEEENALEDKGTENAEAYELYIKAGEFLERQTQEGYHHAVNLFTEAIRLDAGYANAYLSKANTLANLYRAYDRDPKLLTEAESLAKQALSLKPELWEAYDPLSFIYQLQGSPTKAEETAKEFIRKAPEKYNSHFSLGFFYSQTGQPAKAIGPLEEALRLKPDDLTTLWNIVLDCSEANEAEKCAYWASTALPVYERHLRLHPDDEGKRVWYANLLFEAGRPDDAHEAARNMEKVRDGSSLYNLACLLTLLGDHDAAMATLRKAIAAGYAAVELIHRDPDLAPLREREDFRELMKELEEKNKT